MTVHEYQGCINTLNELINIVSTKPHHLHDDTAAISDIGLSSIQVLELVERIEDHYDFSFPLNLLGEIQTTRDFAIHITKLSNPSL